MERSALLEMIYLLDEKVLDADATADRLAKLDNEVLQHYYLGKAQAWADVSEMLHAAAFPKLSRLAARTSPFMEA